jgi:hypothetical protein
MSGESYSEKLLSLNQKMEFNTKVTAVFLYFCEQRFAEKKNLSKNLIYIFSFHLLCIQRIRYISK